MQLLHTPTTKFRPQFASPKPNTKKAYMSGCDFCTSKVGEKGNTGPKKQKNKTNPTKSKVELSPQKTTNLLGKKIIVILAQQYQLKQYPGRYRQEHLITYHLVQQQCLTCTSLLALKSCVPGRKVKM